MKTAKKLWWSQKTTHIRENRGKFPENNLKKNWFQVKKYVKTNSQKMFSTAVYELLWRTE